MRKVLALAVVVLATAVGVLADKGANWKVYSINRSKQSLGATLVKPDPTDGSISFAFLSTPDTAFLLANHPSYRGSLLGSLLNKTASAIVGVTVTGTPSFTYFGEPGCGAGTAAVRFFFETDTSGKFDENDYWWSDPTVEKLVPAKVAMATLLTGDKEMEVTFEPSQWTNVNGHRAGTSPYTAAFIAAAEDVRQIGLTFGDGCSFASGVGLSGGSGVFQLKQFVVQQL